MQEAFKDKSGNPLEEGLYNISIIKEPRIFQGYAPVYFGNFKSQEEAIFEDSKGRLYHLSAPLVSTLATKAPPEETRKYILTAKSLIKDIRKYISSLKVSIMEFDDTISQAVFGAQISAKCTPEQEQTEQEENNAILEELL